MQVVSSSKASSKLNVIVPSSISKAIAASSWASKLDFPDEYKNRSYFDKDFISVF